MSDIKKITENLFEQADAVGATEAHMVIAKPFKRKDSTFVLGVYTGVQPAHQVLDKLYEWAEENGLTDVIDKIKELDKDLSFLDEE